MRLNLPNQITLGRFVVAVVFLIVLAWVDCRTSPTFGLLDLATILFVVAASTDFLDGYLARKHNQVTSFGRILDPFVDKILVLGAFVLFLNAGFMRPDGTSVSGLSAWMVVLIVGRELLVSSLRGFSEAGGKPYAANYWGKAKMVVQSVTVGFILMSLGRWRDIPGVFTVRTVLIWMTVLVTAGSVVAYLAASREALAERTRG